MMKSSLRHLSVLSVLCGAFFAHAETTPLPSPGGFVSFSKIQKIFSESCAGCHSGRRPSQGLVLSSGKSYANIVNVHSSEVTKTLVVPGQAQKSYLFEKVNSNPPSSGSRMPQQVPLRAADQAAIRDWINQGALMTDSLLTLASPAIATPNPVSAGARVSFSVSVNNPTDEELTYTWDFGDGLQSFETAPSHSFDFTGRYMGNVVIELSTGDSVKSEFVVVVNQDGGPLPPGLADFDGDGFTDGLEAAFGTSASDATATPSGSPAPEPEFLNITKGALRMRFDGKRSDSLSLSGTLPLPSSFSSQGAKLGLDFQGAARVFTLNDRGKAASLSSGSFLGAGTFSMKLAHRGGGMPGFKAKFSKTDLTPVLAETGFTPSVSGTINVLISVWVNDSLYQTTQPVLFSVKNGKGSGSFTINQ